MTTPVIVLTGAGLFLAGLLAGIELVVRYGVHPALVSLPSEMHLRARREVVRILRLIVPVIMLPSVILAVTVLATAGSGAGLPFRWAGVAAYVALLLIAFIGTVPINSRFFDWNLDSPPSDWQAVIARWALIDVFRSSMAIVAFGLLLVAALLG